MRNAAVVVLAIVLVYLGYGTVSAQQNPSISPEALAAAHSNSIVHLAVSYINNDGEITCKLGTGFVVTDDGYVVTSAALFPSQELVGTVRISGSIGQQLILAKGEACLAFGNLVPLELVHLDTPDGIAHLKLLTDARPAYLRLCDSEAEVGERVTALIYPSEEQLRATTGKILTTFGEWGPAWMLSMTVGSGAAGGPVFDSKGRVIGMIDSKTTNRNGTDVARMVPVKWFSTYLTRASEAECAAMLESQELSRSCKPLVQSYAVDWTGPSNTSPDVQTVWMSQSFASSATMVITDVRWKPILVDNADGPYIGVEDNGAVQVEGAVRSGPLHEKWRGSLKGTLVVTRVASGCGKENTPQIFSR